jgi:hypothetical protein
MWEFNPYLCNNGSHIWTHCLTTVTVVSNVTMEIKVGSLPYLNNTNDTILLNEVREIGVLVLFQNFLLRNWARSLEI